jgi:hypothetical protein
MAYLNGHPMLIEIVGVAGSGKTTLRTMLHEMDPQIDLVPPPRKSFYMIPVMKIYMQWFPTYVKLASQTRWFTWHEIKLMCYLENWLPYLRRHSVERDMVVILDPGSIYWLTALKWFGPNLTKTPKFEAWWEEMRLKWMNAIDFIVWLDAPTPLLLERVLDRDEWHESKLLSSEEAARRFDVYRQGYMELVSQYSLKKKDHALVFHTDKTPADEIFQQVKTKFDLDPYERTS